MLLYNCMHSTIFQKYESNNNVRQLNDIKVPYHFKYTDIKQIIFPLYWCSTHCVFDLYDATHVHQ